MKKITWKHFAKHLTAYRIAVFLSSVSVFFGLVRESLIVGILGFTSINDRLQLYLSIFYTISLSIDAMRLSCLNLYSVLSLKRLLLIASIIGLPFSIFVAVAMSYAIQDLNFTLLLICTLGSHLNLIAALLITYLQRHNLFLAAQVINIMPNFLLIPGIVICHWLLHLDLIITIIWLTTLIPILQCFILIHLARRQPQLIQEQGKISFIKSILTFLRHFAGMLGEQLLQIIIRKAFYTTGIGYLSVYAITIRVYSALRFILIDSFIGSRLALWKKESTPANHYLTKMINSIALATFAAGLTLVISLQADHALLYASIQMIIIFIFGFYFSTLVRVIYFKINHHENNSTLIIQFALYELICAFFAFLLSRQLHYPLLAMLWIAYIAKPFAQLLLLRNKFHELAPPIRT